MILLSIQTHFLIKKTKRITNFTYNTSIFAFTHHRPNQHLYFVLVYPHLYRYNRSRGQEKAKTDFYFYKKSQWFCSSKPEPPSLAGILCELSWKHLRNRQWSVQRMLEPAFSLHRCRLLPALWPRCQQNRSIRWNLSGLPGERNTFRPNSSCRYLRPKPTKNDSGI